MGTAAICWTGLWGYCNILNLRQHGFAAAYSLVVHICCWTVDERYFLGRPACKLQTHYTPFGYRRLEQLASMFCAHALIGHQFFIVVNKRSFVIALS